VLAQGGLAQGLHRVVLARGGRRRARWAAERRAAQALPMVVLARGGRRVARWAAERRAAQALHGPQGSRTLLHAQGFTRQR